MSLLLSIKKISFNRPGVGTGCCSPIPPQAPVLILQPCRLPFGNNENFHYSLCQFGVCIAVKVNYHDYIGAYAL